MDSERKQAEEAQGLVAATSDEPTDDSHDLPCALVRTQPDFLYGLAFSQPQEQLLAEITQSQNASREQVLERLWERVVTSLIAAEAQRVLDEMKNQPGG